MASRKKAKEEGSRQEKEQEKEDGIRSRRKKGRVSRLQDGNKIRPQGGCGGNSCAPMEGLRLESQLWL